MHGFNQRPQGAPGLMPMKSFQGPLGWGLFPRGWPKKTIAPCKPVYYFFHRIIYIRLSFQNGLDKLIVCDAHWHGAHGEFRALSYQQYTADQPFALSSCVGFMLESCVISHTSVFWPLCWSIWGWWQAHFPLYVAHYWHPENHYRIHRLYAMYEGVLWDSHT